ncbi:MAG: hypothetical protein HY329_20160 [Chloroflexi bacterium]|nr:hypothetical protein [Chloroflexota bacterium]
MIERHRHDSFTLLTVLTLLLLTLIGDAVILLVVSLTALAAGLLLLPRHRTLDAAIALLALAVAAIIAVGRITWLP